MGKEANLGVGKQRALELGKKVPHWAQQVPGAGGAASRYWVEQKICWVYVKA